MTRSRLRSASRPRVEDLESRLQPGSMITGPGYGWSLLADNLVILNQGSLDSQILVGQSASGNSKSSGLIPQDGPAPSVLPVPDYSRLVANARSQNLSLPALVDNVATNLTTNDLSAGSLTGHGQSVPLAAVATPTANLPPPATPVGSVPQSGIGVAAPATPIAGPTAPVSLGNVGVQAVPIQAIGLAAPTGYAVTGLHPTNDVQAVPVTLNRVVHRGGAAGNQATLNFLSYLGNTGPDSVNSVVVRNEGGSNFIYVSGSFTDSTGRTDAFAAKLTDGATSMVWMTAIPIPTLPGPDNAPGLAVNGNTVYLATTVVDPGSTPQTNAFVFPLDATLGTLGQPNALLNASAAAVTTDAAGNVYVAGSVGNPGNPGESDIAFFKLSADLKTQIYGTAFSFMLAGSAASSGVTTGSGLVVDSQGNAYFGGFAGVVGNPTNETLALFGQLNAAGDHISWANAFNNPSHGPGAGMTAVALEPNGTNMVFTGNLSDTANAGNPLNQDLILGRADQTTGTVGDAFQWTVDPRDGSTNRSGDWQGNSLVVLANGSTIVGGATYDPSAGMALGDPASKPTKGIDVTLTHFVKTDNNTTQNADGDPENDFGGSKTDIGLAVAQDPNNPNNIYVVGTTNSPDLPTTAGVVQPTYSANQGAVTGATNASPIVITSPSHGLTTGERVNISGVTGNTAANGDWTITVIDASSFSLNGSTGNGDYISGGTWQTRRPTGFVGQATVA